MIAAPLFHAWGFAHFTLGMGLSSTIVLKRKFDPEATLSLTAQHELHRARRRAGDAAADPRARRRGPRPLRPLDACGRAGLRLGAARRAVATAGWTCFGENLYNLYGSTEVAWATIATPRGPARRARHRRQAAARHGREALRRRRQAGRRAARPAASSSATSSSSRATPAAAARTSIDGLMSSGDVGHFDDGGPPVRRRPRRRHDRLAAARTSSRPRSRTCSPGHDAIAEVAVFGVDDEKFGQRLKAVVVLRKGARAERGRGQEVRQGQPRRLQGPARRRVRRRAARARRPARCSSASCKRTEP